MVILDPLRATAGVRWGAAVIHSGTTVDTVAPDLVLPTASVGRLFLLPAVAEQLELGTLDRAEVLAPAAADAVADSGLLQHLDDQWRCLANPRSSAR